MPAAAPAQVRTGDVFVNEGDGEDTDPHYDYLDDEEEDDDGIFDDRESIFSDREFVDTDSDLVTRTQEQQNQMIPHTPRPSAQHKLVAVFARDGQMVVAKTTNGQRVEEWRPPTEQEWNLLKAKGRIVQQGVPQHSPGAVNPPAVGQTNGAGEGTSTWKKVAVGLVALGALSGLGYYAYKHWKKESSADEPDEEVEL